MSPVCVPILVFDADSALRDAHGAKAAGADLVEFRVDGLFDGSGERLEEERIVALVSQCPLPCIVTCRPTSEGGMYDGDDDARISLFERLGTAFGRDEHPPRYLDVELSTYTRSANIRQKVKLAVEHPEQVRDLSTSLILSIHDHRGRPADLTRRLVTLRHEPAASVHKIALMARSLRDNLELFDILKERDRPTIALAMGEYGLMSRVLAGKFGGFLTFASLRPEAVTAPGQPTVSELLGLYRFRSIRERTAVYGVIGHPVSQSMSPAVHNAGFEAVGHDGVYLPLPVPAGYESFKATVLELLGYPGLDLRGLSVTSPHKENLARLAREQGWRLDEASDAMGSANTVVVSDVEKTSAVSVLNTDTSAILESLRGASVPPGARVGIIGAGGAGRSAAWALARAGCEVVVLNRSPDRANALKEDAASRGLRIAVAGLESPPEGLGAVINCTPLGMAGGPEPSGSPMDVQSLAESSPGVVVMDTVYNPEETVFLASARAIGLSVISGVSMFVHQAAAQFSAWTGREAPKGLFERIVRESVGARGR